VKSNRLSWLFIITASAGSIVLIGYFVDWPFLHQVRSTILHWAALVSAAALIVGIINLARVHWLKSVHRETGWGYSIILISALVVTVVVGLITGPTSTPIMWAFTSIVIPVEASLVASVSIALIYAASRLPVRRRNAASIGFFIIVLVSIAGRVSFGGDSIQALVVIRTWINQVWSVGGLRGLLIGVAIGTLATGVRVLIGRQRPYEG
jgi:hypothetical protein